MESFEFIHNRVIPSKNSPKDKIPATIKFSPNHQFTDNNCPNSLQCSLIKKINTKIKILVATRFFATDTTDRSNAKDCTLNSVELSLKSCGSALS